MQEPKQTGDQESRAALARVFGRGSIYTLATVVQLGAGILTIPVLTRIVTPEQYGEITAALVVQAVLATIATFGSPAAISRTYFRKAGPQGARALVAAVAAVALLITLLAELTGPIWAGLFEGLSYDWILRLAAFSAWPTAVLIAAQTALQAADRPRAFVVSAAIATAGAQLLGLALAAFGFGPVGYLAGVTVGLLAAAASAWGFIGVSFAPLRPSSGGAALIRSSLRIAVPTIPHTLALYLLSAADRIVIERLEGLAAAGAYYIAYAVGALAIFLVTGVNGAWGPTLFGASKELRWEFMARSSVEIARVISLAVGAIALVAPIALHLFAPSDYDLSGLGSVSALAALSGLPYLWYIASYNIVVWQGRTLILAIATPVSVVVNIGLCFALVPPLGLAGAALATVIGYTLLAILTWLRARSLADVPWNRRALALATLPAFVGAGLAFAMPDDGAWLVVRALAAAGFGLLAATRLIAELRAESADPALN